MNSWVIWLGLVYFVLLVAWLWRINVVFGYRYRLIKDISEAGKRDIQSARDVDIERLEASLEGRWVWFGSVGATRMLLMFWRSPSSFYPDRQMRLKGDFGK